MLGRITASVSLVLLVALALPASANHPQATSGDVLVFDHKTGNEWWVEVLLSGGASGSVSGVQAMDTDGPWVTMAKKSWGPWAGSFHIEPGHQVKFRASFAGGETVTSCWFDHPAGTEQCGETPPPPPPPSDFDATFSNVKGNEWWAELRVTANEPVRSVALSVDCGADVAMQFRADWGKWVLSTHIPNGAKVTFTAIGDSGGEQSGGYLWPQATPTSGCGAPPPPPPPPPSFTATFSNVKGNEWWVEAKVTANEPLQRVEARVGCDADGWRPLALRSWGAWAASFHVPPGMTVDFRATSADGDTDLSGGYVWPQATPTEACGTATWPQMGSFVTYTLHGVDEGPGSPIRRTSDATLRITYDGTRWSGTCTGTTLEEDSSAGTSRRFNWTAAQNEGPPSGPRSPTVGSTFPVHPLVPSGFGGCGHTEEVIQVTGQGMVDTHMRHPDGRVVSLMAWIGQEPAGESGHHDSWVAWEKRLGLLVEWMHGGHAGSYTGSMTDTDAPVR